MIFIGPPGTGKSHMARAASQEKDMAPPTFHCFATQADNLKRPTQMRTLENRLRETFSGFEGVPIRIFVHDKHEDRR